MIVSTAYTQELLEAVEKLDKTRLSTISKIEPVGRIFRNWRIAP